ncbi:B-cell receptor CD22-like isoform X2 [Clupea harengus]|uniref:B-cell receptor CD22-like isoform X2 n=1 Tax=Clupea harengus TaxID=7950 RepID=A0A8M1KJ66_CLUHA|nr:B-cell receptor CD22-like isoform X2 [Clupea harengus]
MHFCEGNTCLVAFLLSLPGVLDCWSVTYTPQSICAMRGSSVTMGCSYSYPNRVTVTETFWHEQGTWEDLSKKDKYKDRVKFLGNTVNNCSMKMEGLRESDSGEYQFKFITNYSGGRYSGSPGVTLSVSTLQVVMSPPTVTEGQRVTLTCNHIQPCPANANPTYIWYQDRKLVSNQHTMRDNPLILNSVSSKDSGNYSCALSGHKDYPSPAVTLVVRYAPRNVSVSLSPSGNIVEGDSVTLTCSSDANPPATTYTWFKMKRAETFQMEGSGWRNQITNISSEFSGHYHCEAKNDIGASNSSAVLVDVHYPPKNTSASFSPSGNTVDGDSVTLTCSSDANPPVHNCTWYKKTGSDSILIATWNSSSFLLASGNGGLYYCVAHNEYGSHKSSEIEVPFAGVPGGLFAVLGIIPVVALIVVLVFACRSRRGASTKSTSETVGDGQKDDASPVYENTSAVPRTSDQAQRVQFCSPSCVVNQTEDDAVIYSNID